MIKDIELLKNYNKIWEKIEKLMKKIIGVTKLLMMMMMINT